jgi:hypothetical protein
MSNAGRRWVISAMMTPLVSGWYTSVVGNPWLAKVSRSRDLCQRITPEVEFIETVARFPELVSGPDDTRTLGHNLPSS